MDVKNSSELDWQKGFDKWWDNHSKNFITGTDGPRVEVITFENKDEEDLARAAARSSYFHVYDMWKSSELMRARGDREQKEINS